MSKLLTKEDIKRILSHRFKDDEFTKLSLIPPPALFKDMQKAAKRVKSAIEKKELITIVGDYDVDGVIALALLAEFLDDIGAAIEYKIPNRFKDGYGISEEIVDEIEAGLIITVDNGITADKAAELCKKKGIDLIITDHHTPPDILPDAFAIIDPKQKECGFPIREICGAQVAWYLAAAIKEQMGIKYNLSKFLDILSIAIIADMMELRDLNRTMVKSGIKYLNRSDRPFLQAIKEYFKKEKFKSEDISYIIAPLINSAGRMDDASHSLRLVRAKNIKEALMELEYIVSLNNERKMIEKELFEKAKSLIKEDDTVIVVWGEKWHEGVLGIVASRLAKKFQKPSIVFSIKDDIAKGSARSVGNIDILSLIKINDDLLLGSGGHKLAAGLSLKISNLEPFKSNIQEAARKIEKSQFLTKDEVLGEIDAKSIDFELLQILEEYEPYGQKNPKPAFMIKDLHIKSKKVIGKNQNHLKMILQSKNISLESLYFNFEQKVENFDKKIDIVFSISKNEYRGFVTPQLLIKQILSFN